MGPFDEHAVVSVFSTQVLSHDEDSILVEAGGFEPMRWFLAYATNSGSLEGVDADRPRKRQRLSQEEPEEKALLGPLGAFAEDEIPIHRACIDFHFPETLHTGPANKERLSDDIEFEGADIPVVPYAWEKHDEGSRLRITTPANKDPFITVNAEHIPDTVNAAVDQMVVTRHLTATYASQRAKTHPATALRCTLKRSVGQLFNVVRLEIVVSWRSGLSAISRNRVNKDYDFLVRAYEDKERALVDRSARWSPADFYESVHVPEKSMDTGGLYEGLLESELYPFQKRTVNWMLRREGVQWREDRMERIPKSQMRDERVGFFKPALDLRGRPCYVNHLQGIISRERPSDQMLSGGLLAEEMGLGKTVEVMALIAMHGRPELSTDKVRDDYSETLVNPSKATLIITPNSILQQWQSELSKHAPALRVVHYEGIPSSSRKAKPEKQVVEELARDFDVVLATYDTLGRELHFAEDPPERNMRHARKFERKRSPMVQLQWWRICLDEAQMVESGVSAAARVACRLPRVHSWAVTGTPLRKDVQDLHGLLVFLRYSPLDGSSKLWSHVIANYRHLFRRVFGQIALRHTKAEIREELRLPSQKRVVLTLPFSAVEQQHYSTLFNEMCHEVGVNTDGSPRSLDWDPEGEGTVEAMRIWLARLRQVCLHLQVGKRNRKALGRGQGPLRTVAEVLEVMIEQNELNVRIEERAVLNAQLQHAHVLGNNGEDAHRSEKALEIYQNAMKRSAELVQEARQRLSSVEATVVATGKSGVDSEDEESSSESTPLLGRLKNNLRTALQLQHVCTFFAATACFQIKTDENLTQVDSTQFEKLEAKEQTLYESAKTLRKEILRDSSARAEVFMRKIKHLEKKKTTTTMPPIKDLEMAGIESRRIVERADELFDVIREQSKLICAWRAKMAEYLLQPLVDEDEGVETTGEEYEESTKMQDELYVYFDAVKAMQADLNTFITGESAPLIDHEVTVLIKQARKFLDPDDLEKPIVHAPELLLKLLGTRNHCKARKGHVGSVRGLIQEARNLESSMQFGSSGARSESERSLAHGHLNALQKIFSDYSKAIEILDKELDLFRSTQNQRLGFYRQLQELSDAVAPYREELDQHLDHAAFEAAVDKVEKLRKSLAQLKTKHRFLMHLRDESGSQDGPKICVICQSTFENGVLTVCGHQYCKECIQHWWLEHRTCPVCKMKLVVQDFHNITYKPKEYKAKEEMQSGSSSPGSRGLSASPSSQQTSIYSDVDSKLLDEIKSIDLPASYGTKIDTLGRHLHWIREHDPGAKSIVFSQYREFLDVLGTALADFRIGYSRLGRAKAVEKFRNDPSIDCLLLDAKTDSSGMTLVNATHVFICEPLIQTAIELQAIARVHRIGQTRPTTVWMYLINDTVEEAIYEMSVARRLNHVQSRQQSWQGKSRSVTPSGLQEKAIDAANSEELQSAPLSKLLVAGKGGGEMVRETDLWQCLFGKAQKAVVQPSAELETEVGKHLRAEAAEQRRGDF